MAEKETELRVFSGRRGDGAAARGVWGLETEKKMVGGCWREDVVKDNECGRHRQMRNVYAFSFWNLNEFFIAIHKKSINISPGESEGERGGRERKDGTLPE